MYDPYEEAKFLAIAAMGMMVSLLLLLWAGGVI